MPKNWTLSKSLNLFFSLNSGSILGATAIRNLLVFSLLLFLSDPAPTVKRQKIGCGISRKKKTKEKRGAVSDLLSSCHTGPRFIFLCFICMGPVMDRNLSRCRSYIWRCNRDCAWRTIQWLSVDRSRLITSKWLSLSFFLLLIDRLIYLLIMCGALAGQWRKKGESDRRMAASWRSRGDTRQRLRHSYTCSGPHKVAAKQPLLCVPVHTCVLFSLFSLTPDWRTSSLIVANLWVREKRKKSCCWASASQA